MKKKTSLIILSSCLAVSMLTFVGSAMLTVKEWQISKKHSYQLAPSEASTYMASHCDPKKLPYVNGQTYIVETSVNCVYSKTSPITYKMREDTLGQICIRKPQ